MRSPRRAWQRFQEGRRIHDLCDRFRAAMRDVGDEHHANASDQEILLGLKDLVEREVDRRGEKRDPEKIVAATIRALEMTVYAHEHPPTIAHEFGQLRSPRG